MFAFVQLSTGTTHVHLLHTPFVYIGKTHIEMNWEGWYGTMKVKLLWAALAIIIKGHDATFCRREFAYSAFRTIVGVLKKSFPDYFFLNM